MKLKYEAPKGQRIKKGSFKDQGQVHKNRNDSGKRHHFFCVDSIDRNLRCYYKGKFNPMLKDCRWDTLENSEKYVREGYDCFDGFNGIYSIKSFIRALKIWSKHLPPETEFELVSKIIGYSVFGRTK